MNCCAMAVARVVVARHGSRASIAIVLSYVFVYRFRRLQLTHRAAAASLNSLVRVQRSTQARLSDSNDRGSSRPAADVPLGLRIAQATRIREAT